MKILVLSWEFPPRIIGGIARHVAELYPEMVKLGHEVHLITVKSGEAPMYEIVEGIEVHRVPVGPSQNFFHWIANMNEAMGRHGGKLIKEEKNFDIIHAHDWLVTDAAIALKHIFKLPLIATIHATENGRHNGIHNHSQQYINEKEKELVYNAWRVIVCSKYMKLEVARTLDSPCDKIDIIYNGICAEKKPSRDEFDAVNFRRHFAEDREKIVYYLGRMTPEKGISVLIHAAPRVIAEMGDRVKFIMIGGGKTDLWKKEIWHLGVSERFNFTGFMSEENLDKFQAIADCAVFPSLYEPFGIVALESFAARVPVVVSDTGGLPEVVEHGRTGIVTKVGNSISLAQGIVEVLRDSDYMQKLVSNAYQELEYKFCWGRIAKQTDMVYQRVAAERLQVVW
ncbi:MULTISPECIES: glycosyltransferase family 4 protein [Okeania]|uniref:Glycosyltransferase family 1 protein n=1 Tax=Okeania hirsuta TaxID=1458930 RepID=A0A3N6RGH0_9CYAN|nr:MULTISPECIES: glycosyltransferase family 4 protein [Okeania]NES75199.1 glycosyltransferase family 4 protein [Okeania sp. SIO1H4]NES88945.1 glycosyltransferase family 4 protein [Okeania sp. SIO2B9]NET19342.1 glycosyltransferase family 4 protein [Okeania sp. SIO1H5]NET76033.1 glycosyltransferase family 4 protein [Okeania sp. SIO1F9]NET92937.1 glycosyltransferase family 4 protein [Okeania sp. SIO1H2]